MMAPAGTPPSLIEMLNDVIQGIIAVPAHREKLLAQAGEPAAIGPAQFNAIIKEEIGDFTTLAKAMNLKM